MVAVPGPGFPGRRSRRHCGRDGHRVVPAAAVPRKDLVGSGEADGARLVAEELAHSRALLAEAAELGPVPHHRSVEVEFTPILEDVRAERRHALGRRHDDRPGVPLPDPVRTGRTAPDVDHALTVDEGAERAPTYAQVGPPLPLPDSDRRSLGQNVGHPLEPRRHETADFERRSSHRARQGLLDVGPPVLAPPRDIDAIDQSPVPCRHLVGQSIRGADDGEGVEDRVVDQAGHVVPAARLRTGVQLGLQIAPPVEVEHGPVRRRRGVVAHVAAHGVAGLRHRGLVLDHRNETGARDLDRASRPPRPRQSPAERRHDHLAQVASGADAVGDDAVGHLARHLVHARSHRRQEDPGRAELMRPGREDRGHQRVRVEVALEFQRSAVVPRGPDRPERQDVLTHARRRVRPRRAEALLDVPSHLRTHPEHDAPARVLLELIRRVGQAHRVAGEGDGHPCPEPHRGRVLGRQRQRQERVVRRLGRPQAVEPGGLGGADAIGHLRQLSPQPAVDLHEVTAVAAAGLAASGVACAACAAFTRRRTGAGVGAGPFTAGPSTESKSGIPTWTKRPAAGWR